MTRATHRPSVVACDARDALRDRPSSDDSLARECAAAHATLLQRGYVQFHPVLADLVDGFKPALMLGHALYWARNWLQRHPERGGWFWKTAAEWRDATALTPREQESARQRLGATGFWQERRDGSPAQLHFRVDLSRLAEQLAARPSARSLPDSSRDRLVGLLGPSIVYYRPLADLAGGAAGGLVLSHLITAQRTAMKRGEVYEGGFFAAAVEEARAALGIGAKVQRNAREALKRAGFLQEAWTKERCPRLLARLNLTAIVACLGGQDHRPVGRGRSHAAAADPRAGGVQTEPLPDRARVLAHEGNVTRVVRLLVRPARPRDEAAQSRARVAVSSIAAAHPPAKGRPFVETRVALLSNLYSKPSVQKPPTASARDGERLVGKAPPRRSRAFEDDDHHDDSSHGGSPSGIEPLVLPSTLDPSLHEGALQIVARAPGQLRQALLDELAGHLSSKHKVIENPLGWLHRLAAKAENGDLVLTLAAGVAAARASRARYEAALAAAGVPTQGTRGDLEPAVKPAAVSAEALHARARLKELRNQLHSRAPEAASTCAPPVAHDAHAPLSRPETTLNGCALSQDGTQDPPIKGTQHVTHES